MMSSQSITLFTEPPPVRTGPSSFVVSIALHGVACGLILYGISRAPQTHDPAIASRYTVRLLTLHNPILRPRLRVAAPPDPTLAAAGQRRGGQAGSPASLPAPIQIVRFKPAPQTLIQPDLPEKLLEHQAPVPAVLMWSAENSQIHVIVAPSPQALAAIRVQPSLEIPNREQNLADVKVAASEFTPRLPSLPPSNTAPVAMAGQELAQQTPQTVSKSTGVPTPARVISLSDLQMPEGTIAIPMANEAAAGSATGGFAWGHAIDTGVAGNAQASGGRAGVGDGPAAGAAKEGASGEGGDVARAGAGTGAATSGAGTPEGETEPAITQIHLRRDGKFGVVVVGSSLEHAYPETIPIWGGRLAYTVYLHVGLPKSWILQYALVRSAEPVASATVVRPDAPWPFDIARPHLAPGDTNGDAILVHGMVNTAGKFEQLAVVSPSEFTQGKFLLSALQQWQFRPAMQNGVIAAVEVLLIIPGEAE